MHAIVFPAGGPSSWEVKSTRMTSHFKGLLLPGKMQPFFKSPHITVLPGDGGDLRKVEHRKNTKFLVGYEPMHKGSFEHGMNTKGKEENTFLTR